MENMLWCAECGKTEVSNITYPQVWTALSNHKRSDPDHKAANRLAQAFGVSPTEAFAWLRGEQRARKLLTNED